MSKFVGGKIVAGDAPESESPALAAFKQAVSAVLGALQAAENELLRLEQEAKAKAEQIVADAEAEAAAKRKKWTQFDQQMSEFAGELFK